MKVRLQRSDKKGECFSDSTEQKLLQFNVQDNMVSEATFVQIYHQILQKLSLPRSLFSTHSFPPPTAEPLASAFFLPHLPFEPEHVGTGNYDYRSLRARFLRRRS